MAFFKFIKKFIDIKSRLKKQTHARLKKKKKVKSKQSLGKDNTHTATQRHRRKKKKKTLSGASPIEDLKQKP